MAADLITKFGSVIIKANDEGTETLYANQLGDSEDQIDDMYISNESIWLGEDHKVQVSSGGKFKFRKRNKNAVPPVITSGGGSSSGALTHAGVGSLALLTKKMWRNYARSLGGGLATAKNKDIWRDNSADYEHDELERISALSDADNDTKIQVEEGADEDKIRFDTAGTERMQINASGSVGIGTTDTQGAKLAVKSAAYGGGGPHASADEFTIEGSADSGMTIFSGTSSVGRIRFGDSGDNAIGNIKYDHSSNLLGLGANGGDSNIVINSAGDVGIGCIPQCSFQVGNSLSTFPSINLGHFIRSKSGTNDFSGIMGGSFHSTFQNDTCSLRLWPNTSTRAAGNYCAGINFMHLNPQSYPTYQAGAHAGIAIKLYDTPAAERSSLCFLVNPATSSGSQPTEMACILPTGNFGIGSTSPSDKLYVGGGISATGDITSSASDERLKENKVPITSAIKKITQLKGITYDWVDNINEVVGSEWNPDKKRAGLIAQDVQKVFPEVVSLAPFDRDMEGKSRSGKDYLTVDYASMVPLLIEAIKEQQIQIEELKTELGSHDHGI